MVGGLGLALMVRVKGYGLGFLLMYITEYYRISYYYRGGVTQEHTKPAIAPKRCKLGPRLLMTD